MCKHSRKVGQFAVAVRVHDVPNANHAIVTYQYWRRRPVTADFCGLVKKRLKLCLTRFVMGNGIAAERTQVRNVEVILVKDLESTISYSP